MFDLDADCVASIAGFVDYDAWLESLEDDRFDDFKRGIEETPQAIYDIILMEKAIEKLQSAIAKAKGE